MINRINLILKAKNITARQFAEEIGIQPSGMSHIMSGRNNPSLEFVNKVVRRYPEIDANWLLLGRGEMYCLTPVGLTPDPSPKERGMVTDEPTLFSMPEAAPAPSVETQRAASPSQLAQHTDGEMQHNDGVTQHDDLVPQHVDIVSQHDDRENPHVDRETQHAASLQAGVRGSKERRLVKILMFYDDHTFEEYRPQ